MSTEDLQHEIDVFVSAVDAEVGAAAALLAAVRECAGELAEAAQGSGHDALGQAGRALGECDDQLMAFTRASNMAINLLQSWAESL